MFLGETMKLKLANSEDPELHVEGFAVMRLSQIKAKAKSYAEDLLKSINEDRWGNASYYAYSNGVLKELIKTILRYEQQQEGKLAKAVKKAGSESYRSWKQWEDAVKARGLKVEMFVDVENGPSANDDDTCWAVDAEGNEYGWFGAEESEPSDNAAENTQQYSEMDSYGILFDTSEEFKEFLWAQSQDDTPPK